ncbi:MAG: LLM class flavin-dependent oxidoreductase [Flavobacteriaceae bacterium]|nr:LLM class flavin-dependent oxidoreductase [Flavobacteriaceae bacterium]
MKNLPPHPIKGAEISWFAPLCDGDDDFLGHRNPDYKSSWDNTSNIVKTADALGFQNVLCPSSYQVGQDTLSFVAGMAPLTQQINLLAAIRCGEVHPPMLARTIATLDHMLEGRLTINIISSDLPGTQLSSPERYARSREVIEILKQAWTQDRIDFKGHYYQLDLPTGPVKPYQQNGGPLLYFGGYSPNGVDLCAEHCDVYLMWPETEEKLQGLMDNMTQKAAGYNRTVQFGLRVHVIVRETEEEARAYADSLLSKLDLDLGTDIRNRAQDAASLGVARQSQLREEADEKYYVEPNLWTGIGLARSGCGAAIVGNPDQVVAKLERYMEMGIRSFILSGYPHQQECELFAKHVLPRIKTVSLPSIFGRMPKTTPNSPLGNGPRT